VANNVRAVKTLFTFGISDGLITTNPAERLSIPKVPIRDFDIFEPRDIERLLASCDTRRLTGLRDQAIVTVLYDSGLLASELVGLRDNDIDWEIGLLRVIGKGDRQRLVPVSLRTLRLVRRYMHRRDNELQHMGDRLFCNQSGLPLTPSGLLQVMDRMGERTGLHVHPHKFRHSFAVQALRNGAREFDIQASLGHTTLIMTRHYARQSGVDLAEAHCRYSPADHLQHRASRRSGTRGSQET
jgi:site-specific recombinase XerD